MAQAASLPLRHAIALGVLQGPTEVLPVSSSGHTVLVPAALGWPYARLAPAHRKAFEVALHAGAALGIVAAAVREQGAIRRVMRPFAGSDQDLVQQAVTTLPAVACGLLLGRPIEERLGGPRAVAMTQVLAGTALWASDRLPGRRYAKDARPVDALLLGVGQAAALAPGVSRAGGVLVAARTLGFRRADAVALSWRAALPVLGGATALKGVRLAVDGLPRHLAAPFAAGAVAALASTFAFAPLGGAAASARSLGPIAAYRIAFGAVSLLLLRKRATSSPAGARRGGAATSGHRARLRPGRGRRPLSAPPPPPRR